MTEPDFSFITAGQHQPRNIGVGDAYDRPSRCTGSVPESISRRTVRDETLRISAVSSIVRSLAKGCRGPCRRPTLICALSRRGESDARRSSGGSSMGADVLGMSALLAIVPSLPIGCCGLCRLLAPLERLLAPLGRRGAFDLRRVMDSSFLCLGVNYGGGRHQGRRDFVSVEPEELPTGRRRPIGRTGTCDSVMRDRVRRQVSKASAVQRL